MCGITGVAGSLRTEPATLQRMTDQLRHRGPDGEGTFWSDDVGLAMRRLAIIDLDTGDQPIFNEDREVCVVYNGEIYNFVELRSELEARGHRFATHGDTEVIVHAYEEFGPECVERLWGMFALAVWDSRRRLLLLARDRLGKKPLVYYADPVSGGLAFASELQALLAHPDVPREVDPSAIDDYLTYLYVPAPSTAYRDIRKLPPGHRLVWQAGRVSVEPYWEVRFGDKRSLTEAQAVEEFGALLRDAVRRRLIADVPLGAFLSGGMDSSSVVAEMAALSSRPVKTFSIGFGERDFDELRYARQVARRFSTEHHELIVEPRALEVLPTLVRHYGEPYGDSSAIPTYYVAQMTRQHVTVALNGDGGDELLAGYERHWAARIAARYDTVPRFVRHGLIRPLIPLLPEPRQRRAFLRRAKRFMAAAHLPVFDRYLHWVGAYTPAQKAALYTPEFVAELQGNDSGGWLRAALAPEPRLDPVDAVLRADTLLYLPEDLLAKVDIASMANSLEARSPFLDHRLVEFCARLPSSFKLRGRTSKWLLRTLMRDRLPADILTRPKMGFGVPVGEWLRGDLRPLLEDTLFSPTALQRGYFRREAVRALVDEHLSRRADRGAHVWALLMLELWQRERAESFVGSGRIATCESISSATPRS
ncbi:MAG: asparagine synthase (glutamine-hydrolyzing) [Chloroflexi bacterium]|nr:asparagine synthase (glutamine-hydrolyzing) [Chloroflexota bacterium]